MKRLSISLAMLGLLLSTLVWAQSGGDFAIHRSTIDTGAGTAANGNWLLRGTIGQPDPGHAQAGAFDVRGGFWASSLAPSDLIFADGFE